MYTYVCACVKSASLHVALTAQHFPVHRARQPFVARAHSTSPGHMVIGPSASTYTSYTGSDCCIYTQIQDMTSYIHVMNTYTQYKYLDQSST